MSMQNRRKPKPYGKPAQKSKESHPKEAQVSPEEIRLNKYIANAGICSRREADKLIADGAIKVNGKVIQELGFRVKAKDVVKYKGQQLNPEKKQYILLNKPKGFITTTSDPKGRRTVMELVENACSEQIFPVGRLDRTTTGLLLFTNDGELAKKLTHPTNKIKKVYQVSLDKAISKADFLAIVDGLTLDDGAVKVDDLAIVSPDEKVLGIEIHLGKNRIVRRIFEHLGYRVEKLDRVMFGNLTKKDLPRGKWRELTEKEIRWIK